MTNSFGKHIYSLLFLLSLSAIAFAQDGRMYLHQMRRRPGYYRPNTVIVVPGRPVVVAPRVQVVPPPGSQMVVPSRQIPVPVLKIQSIKVNFVNRQLNLPSEQSARFLPLYSQYLRELFIVQRLKRNNSTNPQVNSTEQIQKNLAYDKQLLDIRSHYTDEFLKILPPEKVSLISKAENEFYDEIVRQPYERTQPSRQQQQQQPY